MSYDSKPETLKHIADVQGLLDEVIGDLGYRRAMHDRSKLIDPERSMYDKFVPKLAGLVYGSDEYKQTLKDMGPALQHHYQANPHHPEFHERGIRGMSLMDVTEMLCDWTASIKRGKDGNLQRSIAQNQERFGYSDELREILENTVRELGW